MSRMIPLQPIYAITGCKSSLGNVTKMPGPSYSLPTSACITGRKLAKIPGSVCSKCYADNRGNYRFGNVQETLQRRLHSLTDPLWAGAMATLISRECMAASVPDFRWHDSGDLQSVEHLSQIADVAERTPFIRHWLPTREYAIVLAWLKHNDPPPNLIIRISAHMIDGPVPSIYTRAGARLPVAYVHQHQAPKANVCPAPEQGNFCGDCRRCWDPAQDVSYRRH